MGSPGKAPVFDGTDYDYWKVRMRAYLLSLGSEVWEICEDPDYENLAVRATELQVRRHEANSKAYNALITCLAHPEFDRVSDLLTPERFGHGWPVSMKEPTRSSLGYFRLIGVNTRISLSCRVRVLTPCSVVFN